MILNVKSMTASYGALKELVEFNPELASSVEEVIQLDVSRSEHQMPSVEPEMLKSVLRTYALYNPEIEYCQGLNYVAGFLIMVFKDPEVAFKALITIVERFSIADLFD